MRFGYYKNAGLSRSTFVSKYVNTSDALIFTPQSAPLGSEINLHAELPMSGLVDNIVTEIRRGAHDQTFQCLFNFIPGSKDFMRRLNNTTYIASQASSRIWRRKMVRSSKETEDAEVLSIECEPPTSFPHPCLQPACKHPVDIVVAGGRTRIAQANFTQYNLGVIHASYWSYPRHGVVQVYGKNLDHLPDIMCQFNFTDGSILESRPHTITQRYLEFSAENRPIHVECKSNSLQADLFPTYNATLPETDKDKGSVLSLVFVSIILQILTSLLTGMWVFLVGKELHLCTSAASAPKFTSSSANEGPETTVASDVLKDGLDSGANAEELSADDMPRQTYFPSAEPPTDIENKFAYLWRSIPAFVYVAIDLSRVFVQISIVDKGADTKNNFYAHVSFLTFHIVSVALYISSVCRSTAVRKKTLIGRHSSHIAIDQGEHM